MAVPTLPVLVALGRTLGVSLDVLAGMRKPDQRVAEMDLTSLRLWRRLRRVRALGVRKRQQILQFIDAIAGRDKRNGDSRD